MNLFIFSSPPAINPFKPAQLITVSDLSLQQENLTLHLYQCVVGTSGYWLVGQRFCELSLALFIGIYLYSLTQAKFLQSIYKLTKWKLTFLFPTKCTTNKSLTFLTEVHKALTVFIINLVAFHLQVHSLFLLKANAHFLDR